MNNFLEKLIGMFNNLLYNVFHIKEIEFVWLVVLLVVGINLLLFFVLYYILSKYKKLKQFEILIPHINYLLFLNKRIKSLQYILDQLEIKRRKSYHSLSQDELVKYNKCMSKLKFYKVQHKKVF